jgi:UDP-N-acetylglucosamine-lysosomal-enzyme
MNDLQSKFKTEFEETSSNKMRNSKDMQFAFSYYYFVMNELEEFNASKLFDEIDLNKNNLLDESEIIILNLKLSSHDFSLQSSSSISSMYTIEANFLRNLNECRKLFNQSENSLINKSQFLNCSNLVEFMKMKFWHLTDKISKLEGKRQKYKFEETNDSEVKFIMIGGDPLNIEIKLNNLIRKPQKFICLNDNIDYKLFNEAVELRRLLKNYYNSLYPLKSQFEK